VTITKDRVTNQGLRIVKDYNREKGSRSNWDSLWQEVADFTVPRKDDIYNSDVRGENKGQNLYDGTAVHASELLASEMNSSLTNPFVNWFSLSVSKELMKSGKVREWLKSVEDITHEKLNNSNFYVQNGEIYADQINFGTAVMEVLEDKEDIFRFRSYPIYLIHIKENSKGTVDTVYREYKYTSRQIVQEFGEEVLDDEKMQMYKESPDKEMRILHAVMPRLDADSSKVGAKNKPIASFHISLDVEGYILKESGFDEFPYMVPRWSKNSNEKYGRGPALKALADVKMINEMTKIDLQGYQLTVAPPLMAPDRSFIGPIDSTPYALNYYRAGTDAKIEPLFTGVNLNISEAKIQRMEDKINQHFFLDQLKLIRGPQMTATEATIRDDENLRILSPVMARQNNEYLKPMTTRIIGLLFRAKAFPEPPAELSGQEFQVEYTSLIAEAQRSQEATKVGRYISIIAPILQIQPRSADVINGDEILRKTAINLGLDPSFLNPSEEVKSVREAREQQAQQQAQQQSQLEDSNIAKNLRR